MAVIHTDGLEIRKITTGSYENNTYILVCPETNASVIIDTPAEPDKILAEAAGTDVKAIYMTHCHPDHTTGHREIKEATGAPVWVHASEADQLPLPPEHTFEHDGIVRFGAISLQTIHVPGHTTGGTSLLWRDHLFSGDVLFPNGPGRTTSPANFLQLIEMLRERIFTMADDIAVHPGHGLDTVMGREKKLFEAFSQRTHSPDLCGNIAWVDA
ncbi:MAG: MBL fold metallo-hydrolase [Chloroflexi bacterium]|nr:MBL fold metallo-hydrolase [Chloroflexota bacterium]